MTNKTSDLGNALLHRVTRGGRAGVGGRLVDQVNAAVELKKLKWRAAAAAAMSTATAAKRSERACSARPCYSGAALGRWRCRGRPPSGPAPSPLRSPCLSTARRWPPPPGRPWRRSSASSPGTSLQCSGRTRRRASAPSPSPPGSPRSCRCRTYRWTWASGGTPARWTPPCRRRWTS